MNPELITAIVAGVGGILTAWNTRQAHQLKGLRDEVNQLTSWRTHAQGYIGTLLFLLAERGIQPPQPPKDLGLTLTVDQPEPETQP